VTTQTLNRGLQQVFADSELVPNLPPVVARLTEMIVTPQTNAADIGRLISAEPALNDCVLGLVNSSYYGFPRRITSNAKAIVLLGFSKVKNMAFAAALANVLRPAGFVEGFDFAQFWRHALGCAVAAETVARRLAPAASDDAFIGALLLHVGKPLFAMTLGERYSQVLLQGADSGLPLSRIEREQLGFTHIEAGARLAERWNLPDSLVEVIRFAHQPEHCASGNITVEIAHLGAAMAAAVGLLGVGESRVPVLQDAAWQALKLNDDVLYELLRDFMLALDNAREFHELAVRS